MVLIPSTVQKLFLSKLQQISASMSAHAYQYSRRRSRSPSTGISRHHHRRRSTPPHKNAPDERAEPTVPIALPFQARLLRKVDFEEYKPIFGLYLDIQKQLFLDDIDEKEVRGRWKRFVGRWNRGELAEGWYDPDTLLRAQSSAAKHDQPLHSRPSDPKASSHGNRSDDEDDGYGPAPPSNSDTLKATARSGQRAGPSIPNFQDLELQRELEAESALLDRGALRHARKADRQLQKEQLEDLAPRAAAGTKDRQLERKADVRLANNAFAASKTDASFAEVPETDLMGDEEGGLAGYKQRKGEEDRKKNDREMRREEILRARRAERAERVQAYKVKEERTMEGLVALAKARFG
ncbi:MAG: hypothetical protein Q9186_002892 [Xanthomendoza sp. 1 TL-2023]